MAKNNDYHYINDKVYTEYCDANHTYCKTIKSLIIIYNNKNHPIPENLLTRYICIVCNNIICWSIEYEDNLILYKDIINKMDSIKNIFFKYISYDIENMELFNILINKINKDELVNIITSKYIYNVNKNILIKIFNKLLEIKYDTKKLLIISLKNNLFDCLNDIFDSKFDITSNFNKIDEGSDMIDEYNDEYDDDDEYGYNKFNNIHYLFDHILYSLYLDTDYKDSIQLIKKIVINGFIIQKNTLKKFIINTQNRLTKNKYIIFSNNFDDICEYLLNNGSTDINISDFIDYNTKQNYNKLCNMIVEHKNSVTLDEFKKITMKHIKINKTFLIKDYLNITDVKNLIYSNKLNYGIKIDMNLELLQLECLKKNNINVIRNILKNINPDIVCLENACMAQDINTIKLLHDTYKLDFNDKCIINYSQLYTGDSMLQRLVNIYKNNNVDNLQNK